MVSSQHTPVGGGNTYNACWACSEAMHHGVAYVLNESFVASSPVPGERKFGGESPKRDDEQESFAQNSSSSMTLPGTVRQLPVDKQLP